MHHVHKLLQEHDEVRQDTRNWVMNEAMNAKRLQQGGTFRNALFRRVDDAVIPIFSEIIATIDQHYNLNLIDPSDQNSPLSQLWLQIFQDNRLMQFKYTDMITSKSIGGKRPGDEFISEFPFSWVVYETVENQWNTAKGTAGKNNYYHKLI